MHGAYPTATARDQLMFTAERKGKKAHFYQVVWYHLYTIPLSIFVIVYQPHPIQQVILSQIHIILIA